MSLFHVCIFKHTHTFSNNKNIWRYNLSDIPFRLPQTFQGYVISFQLPKHTA